MSMIRPLALTLALATAAPALAVPVELITNGGFETGTLSGWAATSHPPSGTCPSANRSWNVSTSGSATGCDPVPNPVSGAFAAYAMNDGFGPLTYRVMQAFAVPNNIVSATLSFLDTNYAGYSGTPRTWSANLTTADFATTLNQPYFQVVPFLIRQDWTLHTINITAFLQSQQGQTIGLSFNNFIPQSFTGGAGIGLDQVSLLVEISEPVAAPEPVSLGAFALGLLGLGLARRPNRQA